MEEHCSGGTCVEGCVEDTDCFADSVCNFETGVCEEAACRSTTLDCGFSEFATPLRAIATTRVVITAGSVQVVPMKSAEEMATFALVGAATEIGAA